LDSTAPRDFTDEVSGADDPSEKEMRDAHASFLEGGTAPGMVRGLVAESWYRSVAAGLEAEHALPPVELERAALAEYREAHPLAQVFPLLYDVLGRVAEDCDSLMAIGDREGRLLWVCGTPGVLRRAERINFVEGAAWDEAHAGTNAPGTALLLDAPVQICAAEHFRRPVQQWSCAAAPIHDPVTQAILGIVDVTGGEDLGSPQTLGMVRAAARLAEAELARLAALARAGTPQLLWTPEQRAPVRLEGLGRPDCLMVDERGTLRLSPRHSEIMVVLLDHPDGLMGEQLAIELYCDDVNPSTLRAEITRLRTLLGPEVIGSRPYRFNAPVESDWQAVSALLTIGRVRDALGAYRGPLLPQSEAPGVVERRDRVEHDLRTAVLSSRSPDLMALWTRSRWGASDLEMWQQQVAALPAASPLRPLAVASAQRLDGELAAVTAASLQRSPS
jgi:hypothetical protein